MPICLVFSSILLLFQRVGDVTAGNFPPNQLGGLTSMNLHDLLTLIILLIGTLGANEIQYMKYTSEYIMKLQLHQHSLLTRKVFSRNNLLEQVFFSISSESLSTSHHLHIQVIFIFRSSSFGSRSSLNLDHHH